MRGRGKYQEFLRNFLSHSAEKCRRGTLQSFINFGYRGNLDERVGGVSRYSVEISLSHSAENLRRGTLPCCCFSKFLIAKKCMDKRERKYQDFHQKFLVSQCRKRPYGNPSVFQHFQVSKKFMLQMVCQDFPSKFFCLTVPKHFVEEAFYAVFQKISGSQKVYG